MTLIRTGLLVLVAVLSACVGHHVHECPTFFPPREAEPIPITDVDGTPNEVVAVRLIGEEGPLVRTRWAASTEGGDGEGGRILCEGITDETGRAAMKPFVGTACVQAWRATEDQPAREGRMTLARCDSRPSVADLGDVPLTDAPLLVSGVVRTPDGAPVAGAALRVKSWLEGCCSGRTWMEDFGGDERVGRIYVPRGLVHRFRAVSDRSGRFAIRGSSELPMLSIEASFPGYVQLVPTPPDDFLFHKGETHCRVVMAPARGRATRCPRSRAHRVR